VTQTDSERGLLAGQRRAAIVREVRERGGVRVTELVDRFRVSDMTIRRDLDALARAGALEKVHGGAVAVGESSAYEPGFEAKADRDTALKEAIAQAAANLVVPGSAIALSAGTTTYALAGRLTTVPGLTVVTNSIRIAERFYAAAQPAGGGPTVVLTGGVRTPSDALVGPVADAAIRSLHFDAVFLGSHGISPEAGLSTPNLAEAETNRALVASARRVIAVADHTKWGLTGLAGFARLSDVDLWITDGGLPVDARETAAEFVGDLMLAEL
jgi:DeoR/GlpR family transcriptional regulator of sugar metabolism